MQKSCLFSVVFALLFTLAGASLQAQEGSDEVGARLVELNKAATSWNRAVEAVNVTPSRDPEFGQDVTVFFSIDANNVEKPVDMSTDVELLVNGKVVGRQRFDITALPGSGFGCNCQPWEMCLIIDGIQWGCVDRWLGCDPVQLNLDPDDLLEVRVFPGPTGIGDIERRDDFGQVVYPGRPSLAVTQACAGQESGLQTLENSCVVR